MIPADRASSSADRATHRRVATGIASGDTPVTPGASTRALDDALASLSRRTSTTT
ncbi:hypothetical protein [Burkholderia cenocepacia]|uniref:hypothetical protein n=1 Tax=Burkholderia cenocepacia TaxID=95486 RepID=UPI0038CBFDFD